MQASGREGSCLPEDPVCCRLSPAAAERPALTSAAGQHTAASEKKGGGGNGVIPSCTASLIKGKQAD